MNIKECSSVAPNEWMTKTLNDNDKGRKKLYRHVFINICMTQSAESNRLLANVCLLS